METSASFEARSAPSSYPTCGRSVQTAAAIAPVARIPLCRVQADTQLVQQRNLAGKVDTKLEKLVETRFGIPSCVGFGPEPAGSSITTTRGDSGSVPQGARFESRNRIRTVRLTTFEVRRIVVISRVVANPDRSTTRLWGVHSHLLRIPKSKCRLRCSD